MKISPPIMFRGKYLLQAPSEKVVKECISLFDENLKGQGIMPNASNSQAHLFRCGPNGTDLLVLTGKDAGILNRLFQAIEATSATDAIEVNGKSAELTAKERIIEETALDVTHRHTSEIPDKNAFRIFMQEHVFPDLSADKNATLALAPDVK